MINCDLPYYNKTAAEVEVPQLHESVLFNQYQNCQNQIDDCYHRPQICINFLSVKLGKQPGTGKSTKQCTGKQQPD